MAEARSKPNVKRPSAGEADDTPLYQLIVKTLRSEIVRGIYPAGTCLPSEATLIERFRVSRHTVRTAIRALQHAGLVRAHQGLGTIIRNRGDGQQGYVHHINTISDLFPVGARTRFDPIDESLVALPDKAEVFPELDKSEDWLRITGDRRMPGAASPFNELETYVAARFAGVGRLISPSSPSIYAILEAVYGEAIGEVEQVVGGFTADGVNGSKVGLKKGAPGIEVRRLHRLLSDNRAAIVSFNRYPFEDYSFSMTLRRVQG